MCFEWFSWQGGDPDGASPKPMKGNDNTGETNNMPCVP